VLEERPLDGRSFALDKQEKPRAVEGIIGRLKRLVWPKRRTTLGRAQDAGRPGGQQDLRVKTETEAEHDSWNRHG
jgi:hypothetical protein